VVTTNIDNVKSGSATINVNELVHLLLENEDSTLLKVPLTMVANIEEGEVGPTRKDASVLIGDCAASCMSSRVCVKHHCYESDGDKCVAPCATSVESCQSSYSGEPFCACTIAGKVCGARGCQKY
jgi:hypothetical protein